jgi:hypothetical protein
MPTGCDENGDTRIYRRRGSGAIMVRSSDNRDRSVDRARPQEDRIMCHTSHYRSSREWWADARDEPIDHERIAATPAVPTRDPDMRVSQAERDEVVTELARHFADGRLTVEEYEERIEAALAARTGHDLAPLLADLPAPEPPAPRRPVANPSGRPARPAWPSARTIAIAAVIVLAIATGPWALWLLWPALVLTRGCGPISHHRSVDTRAGQRRPFVTQRP